MSEWLRQPLVSDEEDGRKQRPRIRVGSVRIFVEVGRHIDVCLLEGADSGAMVSAVGAALKEFVLPGDSWWLVDGEDDLVIPLCSALPDGVSLALRTSSGRVAGNGRLANTTSFARTGISASPSDSTPRCFSLRQSLEDFRSFGRGGDERALSNFERWSRLSTELANERTLLAWVRTALASQRTVFSFIGVKATTVIWQHVYFGSTALLATVSVVFGMIGVERFYKIKKAIHSAQPPSFYNRITIQPALLGLMVVVTVAAVATYSHVLAKV